MGPPSSAPKSLRDLNVDANTFFPRTVTVRVGDRVRFTPNGFHTADFPGRGQRALPLLIPSGRSGHSDAAGRPFWFANNPNLGFNPPLMRSGYGKRATFTGAKRVNTGLPLGDKLKPAAVRFSRTGTFKYLCNVHPNMTGTVRVRRSKGQSSGSVRQAVRRQVDAVARVAPQLPKTNAPRNTVLLGAARVAGGGAVDHFAFLPARLTVPVGTTVEFRMPSASDEIHSATFGPGDERDPASYLGSIAKSFESPSFDSRGVYPSEPPGTQATLTPQLHGNGFWNSGLLSPAPDAKLTRLPTTSRVTFGAPGTYRYLCVIHPFMKGEVVVQ
ncbi:MAG TPA: hypothetical protein VD931_22215 [Baekduia sp.]|nr:hypothetical protein [Baekduia sp.]